MKKKKLTKCGGPEGWLFDKGTEQASKGGDESGYPQECGKNVDKWLKMDEFGSAR